MNKVIARRTDARIDRVANHEEIRREEEQSKQQPAVMKMLIEEQRGREDCGFFESEQKGWPGQHKTNTRWFASNQLGNDQQKVKAATRAALASMLG